VLSPRTSARAMSATPLFSASQRKEVFGATLWRNLAADPTDNARPSRLQRSRQPRGVAVPPVSRITLTSDQTTAFEGEAPEGTTLEAIDLTDASQNRKALDEFQKLGPVGPGGKFSLPVRSLANAQEGDYVRLRAVDASGPVQSIVTVRLHAEGAADTT